MKGTDKSFENLTCSSPEQCPKLELLTHPDSTNSLTI